MKTEKVKVTVKLGNIQKTESFDYEYPENFEEAIEMDSEAKAMKTYLNERKTNFQDKHRREMLSELTASIQKKLEELGIEL